MSNWRWLWVFLLAGLLPACSSGDCDKPCRQADSCPDFSGSYVVYDSVTLNQCDIAYGAALVLEVTAVAGEDGTDISLVLGGLTLSGRVCNTNRINYPLTYDFSASTSSLSGKTSVVDTLSGQFVVQDGGAKYLCASYFHQENGEKDSCRDSLILFSSSAVCQ
jgi:hypothetical protein